MIEINTVRKRAKQPERDGEIHPKYDKTDAPPRIGLATYGNIAQG